MDLYLQYECTWHNLLLFFFTSSNYFIWIVSRCGRGRRKWHQSMNIAENFYITINENSKSSYFSTGILLLSPILSVFFFKFTFRHGLFLCFALIYSMHRSLLEVLNSPLEIFEPRYRWIYFRILVHWIVRLWMRVIWLEDASMGTHSFHLLMKSIATLKIETADECLLYLHCTVVFHFVEHRLSLLFAS